MASGRFDRNDRALVAPSLDRRFADIQRLSDLLGRKEGQLSGQGKSSNKPRERFCESYRSRQGRCYLDSIGRTNKCSEEQSSQLVLFALQWHMSVIS